MAIKVVLDAIFKPPLKKEICMKVPVTREGVMKITTGALIPMPLVCCTN
jgi:hypothetical protein